MHACACSARFLNCDISFVPFETARGQVLECRRMWPNSFEYLEADELRIDARAVLKQGDCIGSEAQCMACVHARHALRAVLFVHTSINANPLARGDIHHEPL